MTELEKLKMNKEVKYINTSEELDEALEELRKDGRILTPLEVALMIERELMKNDKTFD